MSKKINRIIFYVFSSTWGILMTFIGLFPLAYCAARGKVHKFHGRLYGTFGRGWGGVSLGCFFFCGEDSINSDHLRAHESGHGLQNCIWGPLFPFVIAIPSMVRYWYRELKFNRKGVTPPTAYDDIWFEGQATKWGKKYILNDKI